MSRGNAMNVEAHELGKFTTVVDLLVLAAVERGQRHRGRVFHFDIGEHLGFKHTSWTTRCLRPQVESLEVDGSLRVERNAWRENWTLTRRGRGRLAAARRNGKLPPLPESPQHRSWRHAREEASQRFEEIGDAVSAALTEANKLGSRREATGSDHLTRMGERLHWEFRRLALVTYFLHEWEEPDDDRRDRARRDHRDLAKAFDQAGGRP